MATWARAWPIGALGRAPEVRGEARAGGRPSELCPTGPWVARPPARASPRASGARPKAPMGQALAHVAMYSHINA